MTTPSHRSYPRPRRLIRRRALVQVSERGSKQRLVGFTVTNPGIVPEEGRQIVDVAPAGRTEIIGWVTSSRRRPTLGRPIGLCWLRADRVIRLDIGFLPSFVLWGARSDAVYHWGALLDAGEELGIGPVGWGALRSLLAEPRQ